MWDLLLLACAGHGMDVRWAFCTGSATLLSDRVCNISCKQYLQASMFWCWIRTLNWPKHLLALFLFPSNGNHSEHHALKPLSSLWSVGGWEALFPLADRHAVPASQPSSWVELGREFTLFIAGVGEADHSDDAGWKHGQFNMVTWHQQEVTTVHWSQVCNTISTGEAMEYKNSFWEEYRRLPQLHFKQQHATPWLVSLIENFGKR